MSTLNTSRARGAAAVAGEPRRPDDPTSLIEAFERLGPAYMRWVRCQSRPDFSGVTVARLRTLGMMRTLGPQPMGHLARQMGVAARTITALVDGLERDGLARRAPHPTDRRSTMIEITEEGAETLRACFKPHRAAVAALFGDFAHPDRAALARLMPLLVEALEARSRRA